MFKETYESQLGPLVLLINSTNQLFQAEAENGIYLTVGHEVAIKKAVPNSDWLPPGMQVESAVAWLFYISKRNSIFEQLSFSISLEWSDITMQCGGATGQNLIAIEFENGFRQMHIGTEDEDAMAYRASKRNYMPARFETLLWKCEMEITTITSCGLFSKIPKLELGEKFYFHYIVAENPYRQSAAYPNESDASTWFAVDQSKKQLEQNWHM